VIGGVLSLLKSRQSKDRDALRADLAWSWRLRVFALYSSGGAIVEAGAPATPTLRRTKQGAIFEGWWPTCFTRGAM